MSQNETLLRHIDAALASLPKAEPGTQDARDIASIRDDLLSAKARIISAQRRAAA